MEGTEAMAEEEEARVVPGDGAGGGAAGAGEEAAAGEELSPAHRRVGVTGSEKWQEEERERLI